MEETFGSMTFNEIEKFEKVTNSVVLFDGNGRGIGFQKTNDGATIVMIDVGDKNEVIIILDDDIKRLRDYLCS